MKIKRIVAREIIDSRGNPTIEADLFLESGTMGRAAVPSGASTGIHEALELRDNDAQKWGGQGVEKAISNVNTKISDIILGKENLSQLEFDKLLLDLDGTSDKSNIGANAILAASLAYAWAVSRERKLPLYKYIGEIYGNSNYAMPRPLLNIMNGGKHANWATDIQEYMLIPVKAESWADKLRIGVEIYHNLEKIIKAKGLSTNVGNEGGFAPLLSSNQEALDIIVEAIAKSNYKLGEDIMIGFDAAASEFYNSTTQKYELKRDGVSYNSAEMLGWIKKLVAAYPVLSLEDMFSEDDWEGWHNLTMTFGDTKQIVGDDLLVTNTKRIERAIAEKACNALLVKVNQIGSLTEALNAMKMASNAGWNNILSHRSGETEDITIAHIAVGTGCGQIKTGAPARGERTAKYNELTRIAEEVEKKL